MSLKNPLLFCAYAICSACVPKRGNDENTRVKYADSRDKVTVCRNPEEIPQNCVLQLKNYTLRQNSSPTQTKQIDALFEMDDGIQQPINGKTTTAKTAREEKLKSTKSMMLNSKVRLADVLSESEGKSLILYSDLGYRIANGALRGTQDYKQSQGLVLSMASALAKLRPFWGQTSVSVIRWEVIQNAKLPALLETYATGSVILERGFLSTSINAGFGENMPLPPDVKGGKAVIFLYKILSKSGVSIEKLSIFGEQEREILFSPGTEFKVLSGPQAIKDQLIFEVSMEEIM
jgi:hypothetical protein